MPELALDRLLQSQGFGTRRWCRTLIEQGKLSIEGDILTDYKIHVDTHNLVFRLFDQDWLYREYVYVAINKPPGIECSRKPSHHPAILTLLPEVFSWRQVQPVGRLDHDTTGLLLLSDDGAFIHQQSSPKRHIPKVYVATTFDTVTHELIHQLSVGVQLHDEPLPIAAQSCRELGEHQIEIILEQGKYHQVKRMLAAAGNHCTALQRTAIGSLQLAQLELEIGEWCYLNEAQLNLLKSNL